MNLERRNQKSEYHKRSTQIQWKLARPERFELPTTWFEARDSIQLSYGRIFIWLID
jgi:hypothetical protein